MHTICCILAHRLIYTSYWTCFPSTHRTVLLTTTLLRSLSGLNPTIKLQWVTYWHCVRAWSRISHLISSLIGVLFQQQTTTQTVRQVPRAQLERTQIPPTDSRMRAATRALFSSPAELKKLHERDLRDPLKWLQQGQVLILASCGAPEPGQALSIRGHFTSSKQCQLISAQNAPELFIKRNKS